MGSRVGSNSKPSTQGFSSELLINTVLVCCIARNKNITGLGCYAFGKIISLNAGVILKQQFKCCAAKC